MAIDWGFNFRNTLAFVTDAANEVAVLGNPSLAGEPYPTVRGGRTFGWDAASTYDARDRAVIDRRLSGLHGQVVGTFRIDLPNAMKAAISLSLGDQQNARTTINLSIKDGVATLLTVNDATGPIADHFDDATGADLTEAAWPGSNLPVTVTFAGSVLTISVNDANTTITHIRIVEQAASGSAWPVSTRQAPAKAGPFDQRGFLLSPFQRYSYVPSFTLNAYSFSADPGTYAVTGAAAGLRRGAALSALAGSYTLTGAAAKLLVGHAVNAGTATYAINGVSATELRTLLLNAGTGSYVLSGFAATLQAPSPDHPLAVNPATYALSGASAAALRGVRTTVTGAYAISGAPALFLIQRGVPDGPSSYNVNGLAATLIYSGSGPAARVPWQRMGMRIGL